jgi:hypothetical protein
VVPLILSSYVVHTRNFVLVHAYFYFPSHWCYRKKHKPAMTLATYVAIKKRQLDRSLWDGGAKWRSAPEGLALHMFVIVSAGRLSQSIPVLFKPSYSYIFCSNDVDHGPCH